MRQSRDAKAETHEAIVAEASRLFRGRGVEGTSVADVMQAAKKTHGGFYRHFDSKEALLAAALDSAFADMLAGMIDGFSRCPRAEALARFIDHYLSDAMVADVAGGCPIAALSGDVMRGPEAVQQVFGAGVRRVIETIAETLDGPADQRLRRAAQTLAMAAGAVMIARASDPDTAALVLDAVATNGAAVAGPSSAA